MLKEQNVRQMFDKSKERTNELEKGHEGAIEPIENKLVFDDNTIVEFDIRGPKIYYNISDEKIRVIHIDTEFVRESDNYTKTYSKKFRNAYSGSQMYHSKEEFVQQFYTDLNHVIN